MDDSTLFRLTYGVFLLSTKYRKKYNACITNTCIQVASNPKLVVISCLNSNLTTRLIKKSKVFTLSILDIYCSYDTIKQFGNQSGHTVDKFAGASYPTDFRGIPYLDKEACAYISCHVIFKKRLGSHTMFVAKVDDAEILNDNPVLTYAQYRLDRKPMAPEPVKKEADVLGWRCKICGFYYEGEPLDDDFVCPQCGHGYEEMEPIYEQL